MKRRDKEGTSFDKFKNTVPRALIGAPKEKEILYNYVKRQNGTGTNIGVSVVAGITWTRVVRARAIGTCS